MFVQNPHSKDQTRLFHQPVLIGRLKKAVNLVDESQALRPNVLVSICHHRDSEAAKGKGNERKKRNNNNNIITSDHADPNGAPKLDPQSCSKLVAVLLKNSEQMDKTLDRLHRWNIHVKLDLTWIAKNTSTTLDIATQTLYTSGNVSEDNPLKVNKYVVVIKNNVCHATFLKYEASDHLMYFDLFLDASYW